MFCTFIFAVLLLKYCFPTGDQLQRYCASDFFLQYPSRLQLLPSYSHFCPNIVGMATGVGGRKRDWQHSMVHPRKSPYRCKNLADISYTDRVLFQILFHGDGCRSEKDAVCSIQWPILETPLPIGAKISQISFTQAEL